MANSGRVESFVPADEKVNELVKEIVQTSMVELTNSIQVVKENVMKMNMQVQEALLINQRLIVDVQLLKNSGGVQNKQSVADPLKEIQHLQQVSSVEVYQDQFEISLKEVDITETHAIDMFIRGLIKEVRMPVQMFNPRSLADAYSLARVQESILAASKGRYNPLIPFQKSVDTLPISGASNFCVPTIPLVALSCGSISADAYTCNQKLIDANSSVGLSKSDPNLPVDADLSVGLSKSGCNQPSKTISSVGLDYSGPDHLIETGLRFGIANSELTQRMEVNSHVGLNKQLCSDVSSSLDSNHKRISGGGRQTRQNSSEQTSIYGGRRWEGMVSTTSQQPFKISTERRGKEKQGEFIKTVQEMVIEREKQQISLTQGLPWTTNKLVEPHVKESTKPVYLVLHSDGGRKITEKLNGKRGGNIIPLCLDDGWLIVNLMTDLMMRQTEQTNTATWFSLAQWAYHSVKYVSRELFLKYLVHLLLLTVH